MWWKVLGCHLCDKFTSSHSIDVLRLDGSLQKLLHSKENLQLSYWRFHLSYLARAAHRPLSIDLSDLLSSNTPHCTPLECRREEGSCSIDISLLWSETILRRNAFSKLVIERKMSVARWKNYSDRDNGMLSSNLCRKSVFGVGWNALWSIQPRIMHLEIGPFVLIVVYTHIYTYYDCVLMNGNDIYYHCPQNGTRPRSANC